MSRPFQTSDPVSVNRNHSQISRIVREYMASLRLLHDLCELKLRKTQRRHYKVHRQHAHQLAVIELVYDKVECFRYEAAAAFAQECRLDKFFESHAWLNSEMAARHYRFVEKVAGGNLR